MHYPYQRPILPPHAPIFVSLFTGAGGADSGAASAGFRPVLGVEIRANAPKFTKNHCSQGIQLKSDALT